MCPPATAVLQWVHVHIQLRFDVTVRCNSAYTAGMQTGEQVATSFALWQRSPRERLPRDTRGPATRLRVAGSVRLAKHHDGNGTLEAFCNHTPLVECNPGCPCPLKSCAPLPACPDYTRILYVRRCASGLYNVRPRMQLRTGRDVSSGG
eukprot:jgi/Ulvmu1/9548/UM053_0037.1